MSRGATEMYSTIELLMGCLKPPEQVAIIPILRQGPHDIYKTSNGKQIVKLGLAATTTPPPAQQDTC